MVLIVTPAKALVSAQVRGHSATVGGCRDSLTVLTPSSSRFPTMDETSEAHSGIHVWGLKIDRLR